jgi:DNA (cytosine-5)-methyltransferase 3B
MEEVTPKSVSTPSVDLSQDGDQEGMDTTQVDAESRDGDSTEYQVKPEKGYWPMFPALGRQRQADF